ncbi:MAG: type II toxin-antitoxin system HicB family antitoxin [Ignavibacteriales bacterium]|nr:type II toxin-antitoxin system HicB family antitoxin [Ignavibacteriales bacterium]
MKKYLIVVEDTGQGYSAFSPDLDGCAATGATKEEVEKDMADAIKFHLEGLTKEGYKIPEPKCYAKYLEVND